MNNIHIDFFTQQSHKSSLQSSLQFLFHLFGLYVACHYTSAIVGNNHGGDCGYAQLGCHGRMEHLTIAHYRPWDGVAIYTVAPVLDITIETECHHGEF